MSKDKYYNIPKDVLRLNLIFMQQNFISSD